ncbi:hypothetical protein L249_8709 [Ophiocordyceps polyrhachis-furcata BCC 54312]|uniref:SGNH hydrolase-type esterase domain-containing protein n=1 Tax=Ophiocordyceps polyrhachis-furcata BCC 54312 TaxID=1330021 RepID=A0A367L755_9HYPO|nr:hypothetical protein L249_8709 [Ophiocordyceps polyrhachis-furcata BCC 54312]
MALALFYFSLAIILASGLAAPVGYKAPYSSMIVFGDSLSDNGLTYEVTNHTWPKDPAYYKGRFSNGPTWAEDVAATLDVPLYDYARGGATTDNALVQGFTGSKSDIAVPSLTDQVHDFLSKPRPDLSTSLVVLLGGANDVYFNNTANPAAAAAAIGRLLIQLRDAGATHFLLPEYPDLSLAPYGSSLDDQHKAMLSTYTKQLGADLQRVARNVSSASPGVTIKVVDLQPLFRTIESNSRALGFDRKGLRQACLVGAYGEASRSLCSDPDRYVYFDAYHPTGKTHCLIANEVVDAL